MRFDLQNTKHSLENKIVGNLLFSKQDFFFAYWPILFPYPTNHNKACGGIWIFPSPFPAMNTYTTFRL